MISMLLLFIRAWSALDLLLSLLNLWLWPDLTHLPTQLGVLGQNKRIAKLGNRIFWQQSAVESCRTSQKQYFPQNTFHSWATCGFKIFLNQDIISVQYCFCSFAELSNCFFWTSLSRIEIIGIHNILEVDKVLHSCTPRYVKKPVGDKIKIKSQRKWFIWFPLVSYWKRWWETDADPMPPSFAEL